MIKRSRAVANLVKHSSTMLYEVVGTASPSVQWFSRVARANRQTPTGDLMLHYAEIHITSPGNAGYFKGVDYCDGPKK